MEEIISCKELVKDIDYAEFSYSIRETNKFGTGTNFKHITICVEEGDKFLIRNTDASDDSVRYAFCNSSYFERGSDIPLITGYSVEVVPNKLDIVITIPSGCSFLLANSPLTSPTEIYKYNDNSISQIEEDIECEAISTTGTVVIDASNGNVVASVDSSNIVSTYRILSNKKYLFTGVIPEYSSRCFVAFYQSDWTFISVHVIGDELKRRIIKAPIEIPNGAYYANVFGNSGIVAPKVYIKTETLYEGLYQQPQKISNKDAESVRGNLRINDTSIPDAVGLWENGRISAEGIYVDSTDIMRSKDYVDNSIYKISAPVNCLYLRAFDSDDSFSETQPLGNRKVSDIDFSYLFENYPTLKFKVVCRHYEIASDLTIETACKYLTISANVIQYTYNHFPDKAAKINLPELLFYPYKFKPQAHRGLSSTYPQNTLLAFEEAAKQDYIYGIETDVQRTSDGVLVLYHDATLDTLTDGTGSVSSHTYAELQTYSYTNTAGATEYPGQKIAKLEDYLKICRKYGKVPYIELKILTNEGLSETVNMVKKMGFKNRAVFTSFTWSYLQYVRSLTDDFIVEAMFSSGTTLSDALTTVNGYDNIVLRFNVGNVSEELVNNAHMAGYLVDCWGLSVGAQSTLNNLILYGVEGATCNDYSGFILP